MLDSARKIDSSHPLLPFVLISAKWLKIQTEEGYDASYKIINEEVDMTTAGERLSNIRDALRALGASQIRPLGLEADRLEDLSRAMTQEKLDLQREVVRNERRQSYENRPYGMAHWHLQEALYPMPHPYHWMTIGSQEDLDAANLDDIKDFFRRFYSPSNGSLAIAGDIDPAKTLELVNRYFGDLPPGPQVQRIGRFDSSLPGRVELQIRDRVSLPRVYIAWSTPPHFSADDAPLEMLSAVMADGLSSRLYRSLVYEKQIAQSVSLRYHASEIAGQFIVEGTAAANHNIDEVEQAIEAELERIRREPPTEEEITRAKNRLEAHHYRQLSRIGGFGGKADTLNHFNVFKGDPNLINTEISQYMVAQVLGVSIWSLKRYVRCVDSGASSSRASPSMVNSGSR